MRIGCTKLWHEVRFQKDGCERKKFQAGRTSVPTRFTHCIRLVGAGRVHFRRNLWPDMTFPAMQTRMRCTTFAENQMKTQGKSRKIASKREACCGPFFEVGVVSRFSDPSKHALMWGDLQGVGCIQSMHLPPWLPYPFATVQSVASWECSAFLPVHGRCDMWVLDFLPFIKPRGDPTRHSHWCVT